MNFGRIWVKGPRHSEKRFSKKTVYTLYYLRTGVYDMATCSRFSHLRVGVCLWVSVSARVSCRIFGVCACLLPCLRTYVCRQLVLLFATPQHDLGVHGQSDLGGRSGSVLLWCRRRLH